MIFSRHLKPIIQKIIKMLRYQTLLLGLLLAMIRPSVYAQNADNYAFTYGNNSSLFDLTSGSITIIESNKSLTASAVVPIGFPVVFMGQYYTSFSANTNGVLRFGTEPLIPTGNAYVIAGEGRIVPFAGVDINATTGERLAAWGTSSSGKVHYKVFGTAPNRYLVVEWSKMSMPAKSLQDDATFQAVIYESQAQNAQGGRIEFRYGKMTVNTSFASINLGIGIGQTQGLFKGIDLSTNPPTARTASNNITSEVEKGDIKSLHSTADGKRIILGFEAAAVAGAVNNVKGCAAGTEAVLSWEDGTSNAVGYLIFRSTDGTDFSFLAQVKKGTLQYTDKGLTNSLYYYQIYAINEGKIAPLSSSGSVTVNFKSIDIGKDRSICKGESITLDGGAGHSAYKWSSGQTTQKITVSPTQTTKYQLIAGDASCPQLSNELTLTVKEFPALKISGSTTICKGQCGSLTATISGEMTFLWSNGQKTATIKVCPLKETTYSVLITDPLTGCQFKDSVVVKVVGLPEGVGGSTKQICEKDTALLDAGSGFTKYRWTERSSGRTANTQTFKAWQSGTYVVEITDPSGCTAADSLNVNVNALPIVNVKSPVLFCKGSTASLQAEGGFKAYLWTDSQGKTISQQPTASVGTAGKYTLTLTNAASCTAKSEVEVQELPTPILKFNGKPAICEGETEAIVGVEITNLLPADSAATYQWKDAAGNVVSERSILKTSQLGAYSLVVTNSASCSSTGRVVIGNCCLAEINIPTAFTPHSTAANNLYRIQHKDVKEFKMQIYNRWGLLVFQSEDAEKGWDGTFSGQKCPPDTYQMILDYSYCVNGITIRKNTVSVIYLLD
jgi:gliding motility-associated-like protein